jgi:hypothetical protein
MVGLSAHSQCVYASYSSRAECLFSSANVAAATTLCSFPEFAVVVEG